MASRTTGRRRWTFVVCVALVAVAVLAVAFQGAPQFTGPRMLFPPGPVQTRAPQPAVTDTAEPEQSHQLIRIDVSWLLTALIVLAVVIGLALLWRLRRQRAAPPELPELAAVSESDVSRLPQPPQREPEPERVRRGLDRASGELDGAREPRDAIERAWLGLEEGAADSGVRRLPAETPAEFTARVVARVAADRDAAQRFLALYLRARFSAAPVTSADVAQAREAVATLRASWTAPAPRGVSTPADRFGASRER